MKNQARVSRILVALSVIAIVTSGCAVGPAGPYYRASENPPPAEAQGVLTLGPADQNYVLQIDDRTPFGLQDLPRTSDMLYDMGYDRVRREKDADFSIDITLSAGYQDNPEVRAGQTIGGALAGAAAGAIIGGAVGNPGKGAAIGAASGGALGLVAPATTSTVRIDINVYSFRERLSSQRTATVDLTHVPPPDVQYVIDNEVARLLKALPKR